MNESSNEAFNSGVNGGVNRGVNENCLQIVVVASMSSFLSGAPNLLSKAKSASPGSRSGGRGRANGNGTPSSPGRVESSDLDSALEALLEKKPKPRSKSKPVVSESRKRLRRNSSQINSAHVAFNQRNRSAEDNPESRRSSRNDDMYSLHGASKTRRKGKYAGLEEDDAEDGRGEQHEDDVKRSNKGKREIKKKKKMSKKKKKKVKENTERSPGSRNTDDDRAAALERELMSQCVPRAS